MSDRVDALERAERERRAGGGSQRGQLVTVRLAQLEGLGDREWPVPEVWLRRQELDYDALFGELAQCQRCLQRRDTSTRNDNPRLHHELLHKAAGSTIRSMGATSSVALKPRLLEASGTATIRTVADTQATAIGAYADHGCGDLRTLAGAGIVSAASAISPLRQQGEKAAISGTTQPLSLTVTLVRPSVPPAASAGRD